MIFAFGRINSVNVAAQHAKQVEEQNQQERLEKAAATEKALKEEAKAQAKVESKKKLDAFFVEVAKDSAKQKVFLEEERVKREAEQQAKDAQFAQDVAARQERDKATDAWRAKNEADALLPDPKFSTCKAAIEEGYGPYVKTDPEYRWYHDADSDGMVCE